MQATLDDVVAQQEAQLVVMGTFAEQLTSQLETLDATLFWVQVASIGSAFLCGLTLWRLTVLAKNQRKWW